MTKTSLMGAFAFALLFLSFQLDVVITKDGGRIEGKIIKETNDRIFIKVPWGEIDIFKERVEKIIRDEDNSETPLPEVKPPEPLKPHPPEEKPPVVQPPPDEENPPVRVPAEPAPEEDVVRKSARLRGIRIEWKQPKRYYASVDGEEIRIASEEGSIRIMLLALPDGGMGQAKKELRELLEEEARLRGGTIEEKGEGEEGTYRILYYFKKEEKKMFLVCGIRRYGEDVVVVTATGEEKRKEELYRVYESVEVVKTEK
ncbi:MAG: hypothetical protein N2234_05725 [Planctomycetota bacterium]|nr:hypothetical protein [Planctomycetota bacterium]